MPLSTGQKLAHYEILEPIGKGGMGEVFRAKDTKLGRDVAIKALPEEFLEDEARLARFQREAQVLASLNHPNIAAIYGVESPQPERSAERSGVAEREAVGVGPRGIDRRQNALVLELVEGPTLADRIAQGPIPLDEALAIARQITEALEAAHEAGIIHRDLKPANVKVRDDGTVKVLDFGLAKALEGEADGDASESPTMTAAATRAGVILGTAAYMSPEQAKGKRVDKRADVWAFGAVLFEMLTGKRAFVGDDVSDTLAAVLRDEPDWDALPTNISPALRTYLERCLEKDPKGRVRDIGDVRLAIDGAFDVPAAPSSARKQRSSATTVAVALILSAITGLAVWNLKPEPARSLVRFSVTPPPSSPLHFDTSSPAVAITPDGSRIVYRAFVNPGTPSLAVRGLDEVGPASLPGLGQNPSSTFLSPDGNWIGYFVDPGSLNKVSILGGPPTTISSLMGGSRGASWGDDDNIVFAQTGSDRLWRVPAAGGEPEALPETALELGFPYWPEMLPGSRAVLFTSMRGASENAQIAVMSLDTGETKILVPGGSRPRYAYSGHIVYGTGGTLRAVGFDINQLEVTSDPVPILEGVLTTFAGKPEFGISHDGSLVYATGDAQRTGRNELVWVDRQGNEEALTAEPRGYQYPRLSPDGRRLALDVRDEDSDVWIWDFARETLTRLTSDSGVDAYPLWSSDGRRIYFGSTRERTNLHWKAADGTGPVERLIESPNRLFPQAISPDGTRMLVREVHPEGGPDLGTVSLDDDASLEPLIATEFTEINGEISPDGAMLAYQTNASGRHEIYVRSFPDVDQAQWQISSGGGTQPLWSRDGRELFYLNARGQLTAVPVGREPSVSFGNPEVVLERTYLTGGPPGRTYDVSPDGERFLMIKPVPGDDDSVDSPDIIVVQNWVEELKRLVPTN